MHTTDFAANFKLFRHHKRAYRTRLIIIALPSDLVSRLGKGEGAISLSRFTEPFH